MKLPAIHGIIDRRILVNFTADPQVTASIIPAPFRPKLYNHKAIVGICLIRLKHIRPKGFPAFFGIASENGAHRIAVEWEEGGQTKEGVYIPRRDSSSRLNAWAGGRLFQGMQLHTHRWEVYPLEVTAAHSDFFTDKNVFPYGSVVFDNALLMKEVTHEWKMMPDKKGRTIEQTNKEQLNREYLKDEQKNQKAKC